MAQAATILMPAGLIALFWPLTSASLFLILYGLTAVYFSGVMVRAPDQAGPGQPLPMSAWRHEWCTCSLLGCH